MAFSDNEELNALIQRAKVLIEALPKEEQDRLKRDQMIDWAYGNLTCTGRRPYITRELVERIYDEREGK